MTTEVWLDGLALSEQPVVPHPGPDTARPTDPFALDSSIGTPIPLAGGPSIPIPLESRPSVPIPDLFF